MSWGLVLSAIGYFLLARVGATSDQLPLFALATFIMSLGAAPVFTLTNDVIIGSAPPERAGAASGISETCAELGGALGIAIFGSIGVAIYRGLLAPALPVGLSAEVTNATLATLGGAVAIASDLSGQVGAALLDAARNAFLRGLMLCAVISGIGYLALAVYAAWTFRSASVLPQHTEEQQVGLVA
jgi:DHA2 family multidrug resistance protein-like MFS transporter